MAKTKKIQDKDWLYCFLRHIVDRFIKWSYCRIKYAGLERIPKDGAVIYAPNHTGTLMDALVILAMDRKPKVFVARADIFKNPKLAKLFRFFKIMPIMRMRDGFDEVKKNNRTIEQAVDVLKDNVPFCIFPEGTHQTKYSLQPLSKGIFRIALQAQELMPDMPLYIVPVGIRYGSFWRYRASAHVQIGEPMNVGKYVAEHPENTPAELMNIMRVALEERMKETLFYIPNDDDYYATYEICAAAKGECRRRSLTDNDTVKRVNVIRETNPKLSAKLMTLGNEASQIRRSGGISLKSVTVNRSFVSQIFRLLLLLLTLPYTLSVSLLASPVIILSNTICRKFKDKAFCNSVRCLINLVVWPLLMIVYAIVAFCCMPWQWALGLILLVSPAPFVVHDVFKAVRILVSDSKLCRDKILKSKYQEINNILFN